MLKTSAQQILQDCFIAHLAGKKEADIRSLLSEVCNKQSAKTLYQKILLSDSSDNRVYQALSIFITDDILHCLWTRHKNLYDLIKELSKSGNHHVRTFLDLIDKISPPPRWILLSIIGASLSGTIAVLWIKRPDIFATIAEWLERTFPRLIQWLKSTFSLLNNLTLIGIISQGLFLCVDWYHTFNRAFISDEKWLSLLCKTLSSALAMTGYLVCTLSAGIMTPLGAILLVLSSSVSIVESVLLWKKNALFKEHEKYFGFRFEECKEIPSHDKLETNKIYYLSTDQGIQYIVCNHINPGLKIRNGLITLRQMPEFNPLVFLNILADQQDLKKSWAMRARYVIDKNYYIRTQKTAKIKFTSAVLSTLAIALWFSCPPSIVMTICCMSFSWLVSATKSAYINRVYKQQALQLQKNLRDIDATLPIKLCTNDDRVSYNDLQKKLSLFSAHQALSHFALVVKKRQFVRKKNQIEQDLAAREKQCEAREIRLQNFEAGFNCAISIFEKKPGVTLEAAHNAISRQELG